MKTLFSMVIKTILLASFITSATTFAEDQATYEVTFTSLWNAEDHISFPRNAHFSPVIAISHNADYEMFKLGSMATTGFEQMAETGATRLLKQEMADALDAGHIFDLAESEALFPRRDGDTLSFTVTLSRDHPYLSLATMIAPSPDWVVGVSNLQLINAGHFISELSADLYALNAGTEEGDVGGNFSINNNATTPQQPIAPLYRGEGFTAPFAKITIKRL